MTKPCTRSGCTGLVTARFPYELSRKRFCSRRCGILARVASGWRPDFKLTYEQRSRGGKIGGSVAGVRRRGRVMRMWLQRTQAQLPASIVEALSARDLARVKALLARTMRKGWKLGYRSGHASKRQEQARARVPGKAA